MNKIQMGTRKLLILGVISLVLSIGLLCGGVALFATNVGNLTGAGNIIKFVVGILLIIGFFPSLIMGIYLMWMTSAMKTQTGSIKEFNMFKGTVNMKKCEKCGTEVKDGEEFCANCGESLSAVKKCECGEENASDAKVCVKCGKEF